MGHQQPYHPRPRWVFIAHPQKLAVVVKILSKQGKPVRPPTKFRSDRPSANGYKSSRWTRFRSDCQPMAGPTGPIGQTARGTGPTARQNRDANQNCICSGKSLPRLSPVQPQPPVRPLSTCRSDRYHRSDRLQGRSDRQQSPRLQLVHLLQFNLQNTLCQLMQDAHKR